MSSAIMNPSPSSHSGRNGRVSFGAHGTTHSLLLERAKANANRRPTPDSEVMVSSDEEHSNGQAPPGLRRASTSRPATSWLSDIGQTQPARKYSLGGLSVGSNSSQPPTPSTETTPRLSATGQGRSGSTVAFAGNIWAPDRPGPNRFSDTPHSPLSLASVSSEQPVAGPQGRRYSGIGVDIPLKPTFKPLQQRAMSFSAAQQISSDDEDVALPFHVHRLRTATQANITRKASLSQVREDEDDVDDAGGQVPIDQAGASQNLLKRAVRHRTFSNNVSSFQESGWNPSRRASTLTFTENAIEEPDDYPAAVSESRRHSLAHVATRPHAPSLSSRTYNTESQQYTPQANHPTTNILSPSASTALYEPAPGSDYFHNNYPSSEGASLTTGRYSPNVMVDAQQREHMLKEMHAMRELAPHAYKYSMETTKGLSKPVYPKFRQIGEAPDAPVEDIEHPTFKNLNHYFNGYGVEERIIKDDSQVKTPVHYTPPAEQYSAPMKTASKIYHLVKFKCERAEVYAMPDGTGLTIEKGQLVIVEGDRGYDIGEVEKANIGLGEVKALRQASQEKHFIWLMMFSRARESNPTVRWALSNLDPHNASARHPENDAEPETRSQNFKMIKRLAIPVEFASLQEKEGDETKAKRICQQKVLEHGLDMEILDAEFQLDRHKLTYFYYAEKYINFNELVNDLFKIFKTRIWMSAVNPASFAPGGHRGGHGTSPTAVSAAPAQQPPALYGAAAYAAQSTLAHTREVTAARHEAQMNPYAQRFPQSQYTGAPTSFGNAYSHPTHPTAMSTASAANAAPPANNGGFNAYAQPFANPTWAAAAPFSWSGGKNPNFPTHRGPASLSSVGSDLKVSAPKAMPGQGHSAYGHTVPGHQNQVSAAQLSPRNAPANQSDRPRKPSNEDDAHNEAVRAAFYSKVTSGVEGLSLGNGPNRRGSFK